MNNHIIMTILFILFVWTGFWFCWVNMISQETREKILQKLHRKKKKEEELKESENSDKGQEEESSSTSIFQSLLGGAKSIGSGASEVSSRLVATAVILAIIFLFTIVFIQILGKEALMLEKLKILQSLASVAIMVSLGTLGIAGILLMLRKSYWTGAAVLILGIWFTLGFLGAFTGMFDIPDYEKEVALSKVDQEKTEIPWQYSQKEDSSNRWKDSSPIGGKFKITKFKHVPREELYFEVCWSATCGDFTSDVGTDETGIYRNFSNSENPEEGRFTGLKWDGEKFSVGRMVCKKNCRTNKRYLFTLKKK